MSTFKSVRVIEDPDCPGEFLLDLGAELCEEFGWAIGDTLQWIDNHDGSFTVKKILDSTDGIR